MINEETIKNIFSSKEEPGFEFSKAVLGWLYGKFYLNEDFKKLYERLHNQLMKDKKEYLFEIQDKKKN